MISIHKSRSLSPFVSALFINWKLIVLLVMLATIGISVLYSAGRASCDIPMQCLDKFGGWRPWALSQLPKFILGFIILFIAALLDIKIWVATSYWIYGASLALLIMVSLVGHTGMGAQRWINLGFIRLQPSELAKIGTIMALAKYFSSVGMSEIKQLRSLLIPLAIVGAPVMLVIAQPDLGTALSILIVSAAMFFLVGVRLKYFGAVMLAAMICFPVIWKFGLRDYQKNRILIFMNPERDVMGTGYHITQSKITIGSGGITGKGYLQGTQSHLNFLPEKQTDFIFTMFAEEFGFVGCLCFFAIIFGIIYQSYRIAFSCRSHFGKILVLGLTSNFFVYFFINTAMVMGLIPVVGVPSPLMSYGGTSVLVILFSFGLIENCNIHKDELISAKSSYL